MSIFRNIRIYPNHGSRVAAITWDMLDESYAGDIYVAFSSSGAKGTWEVLNGGLPAPSAAGMYLDDRLSINSGNADGFYRLLLTGTPDNIEHLSEPVQILGDLTAREYGIVRAIIHREFTEMRVTNGFPVWHCIPRVHGEPSPLVDPDTGQRPALECDTDEAVASYGMDFVGGFYPPTLTWMRVLAFAEGLKDDPDEFSPADVNKTAARLMAFPRPSRGHMLVDPATDRRYLVGEEIKPYRLRGIMPVAFEVTLEFLRPTDPRHKFPVPFLDTKKYRKIPYWVPAPTPVPPESEGQPDG